MKRTLRYVHLLLVMMVALLLTGCWSSKEIEDLGLIVGTSLDLETGDVTSEEQQEARYANRELLTVTNQLVTSETTSTEYQNRANTSESLQKRFGNRRCRFAYTTEYGVKD